MAGTARRMHEPCCKQFSCVELQMEGLTSCFDKRSLVTMQSLREPTAAGPGGWLHYNQLFASCLFGLCDANVTESLIMFGSVSVDVLKKKKKASYRTGAVCLRCCTWYRTVHKYTVQYVSIGNKHVMTIYIKSHFFVI